MNKAIKIIEDKIGEWSSTKDAIEFLKPKP